MYQKYEETPSKQLTAVTDGKYNAVEKKYPKPNTATTKPKITKFVALCLLNELTIDG